MDFVTGWRLCQSAHVFCLRLSYWCYRDIFVQSSTHSSLLMSTKMDGCSTAAAMAALRKVLWMSQFQLQGQFVVHRLLAQWRELIEKMRLVDRALWIRAGACSRSPIGECVLSLMQHTLHTSCTSSQGAHHTPLSLNVFSGTACFPRPAPSLVGRV